LPPKISSDVAPNKLFRTWKSRFQRVDVKALAYVDLESAHL